MLSLLTITPVAGCHAQSQRGAIADLARGWSSNADPACEMVYGTLPGGATDSLSGVWECEWRAATGGGDLGRIWETRDARASGVVWNRLVLDAADADRFADSLSTELTARGLRRHDCEPGRVPAGVTRGSLWSGAGLAVYVSRITPRGDVPRFAIAATDDPEGLPEVMRCGAGMVEP